MPEDRASFDPEKKRAVLRQLLQGRAGDNRGTTAEQPSAHGATSVWHLADAPEVGGFFARREYLGGLGLVDPCFHTIEGATADTVNIGGRKLVNFSSYNYLGLAGDPRVKRAAQDAIEKFGTSASASRLTSGERPLHHELEQALAAFLGVEDAMVFTAGYATNVAVLNHILGSRDLVIYDELAHNSIIFGCQTSRAKRLAFPHNDLTALGNLLQRNRVDADKTLIVVEGAYSTDGDYPDLPRLISMARQHKASIFVDEAHSLGVMGRTGRGIREHFAVEPDSVDLWMGTLSKSLASVGGYVAGNRRLIKYLKYTVPGFVFSAGMPPANAAAALTALRLLEQEPWRIAKLMDNARVFLEEARAAGLDTGLSRDTAVVPIIVRDSIRCLRLATALFEEGINVFPMIYPAVAEGQARLRFFISAEHTTEHLREAVGAVARLLRAGGPLGAAQV